MKLAQILKCEDFDGPCHDLQGDLTKPEKWLNEPGPGDGLVASKGPSNTRRGRSTNAQILTATEGRGQTTSNNIVIKYLL